MSEYTPQNISDALQLYPNNLFPGHECKIEFEHKFEHKFEHELEFEYEKKKFENETLEYVSDEGGPFEPLELIQDNLFPTTSVILPLTTVIPTNISSNILQQQNSFELPSLTTSEKGSPETHAYNLPSPTSTRENSLEAEKQIEREFIHLKGRKLNIALKARGVSETQKKSIKQCLKKLRGPTYSRKHREKKKKQVEELQVELRKLEHLAVMLSRKNETYKREIEELKYNLDKTNVYKLL